MPSTGTAIATAAGAILGTFLLPGVGTVGGAALGAAIGGTGDAVKAGKDAKDAQQQANQAAAQAAFDAQRAAINQATEAAAAQEAMIKEIESFAPYVIGFICLAIIIYIILK